MTTTDLAAWLIDRIAEDEAVARAATMGPWTVADNGEVKVLGGEDPYGYSRYVTCDAEGLQASVMDSDAAHIARHDPARVLAECAAKRRVVERYTVAATRLERQQGDRAIEGIRANESYAVLKLLALTYADRDGYDPAWAVE